MAAIYTLTIFVSAFLVFLIQPMLSKLLLPYLGGVPAVWNTSMVFYQFLLLGGYLYSHFGFKILGIKRQAILHIIFLFLSLLLLPLSLKTGIDIVPTQEPIFWLVAVLFLSVGLPFFLLSANAPMLQNWFAHTNNKNSANPYFLYSASNFGSFVALFAYPTIFEPFFKSQQQMNSWSMIYLAFCLLISLCFIVLFKNYAALKKASAMAADKAVDSDGKPNFKRKLYWIVLAFVPSSLMLGVTTYVTTDVASIPLLWIIPLGIYLLTFVFAFAKNQPMFERSLNAQVPLIAAVVLMIAFDLLGIGNALYLHLFMFFAVAMVCHGQLSKAKPEAKYLTEFYLWISFGGVLGGVFNALLAPVIFNSIIEYQIIIVLSCLLRPLIGKYNNEKKEKYLDLIYPLLVFGLFVGSMVLYSHLIGVYEEQIKQWDEQLMALHSSVHFNALCAALFAIIFIFICAKFHKRPIRFGLVIIALLVSIPLMKAEDSNELYVERNFFGVLRVKHHPDNDYNSLMHGTTLHGVQRRDKNILAPTTYYGKPLGEVFAAIAEPLKAESVGIIGLGVGTVACYGKKGQKFDFYEIDVAVEKVARNTEYFSYLSDCPPESNVIIGDGRLEINKAEDESYGLIIIDAFSSDSIPVHLLTSEALYVYMQKLKEGGLIAFHISSRHLEISSVIASLVHEKGMKAVVKKDDGKGEELAMKSQWVVAAEDIELLKDLQDKHGWNELKKSNLSPWTDNYSNILQIMF